MNLTLSQKFQIALCTLGVFVAGTSQLEVLIGHKATTAVVAFCGLAIAMVSGIGAIVTGQGSQIASVAAMPGVDRIVVNKDANATLATLAVSSDNNKVEATPAAQNAVAATAAAAA